MTPTFEIFRFVSILTSGALLNDLFEDDGNMELKSLKCSNLRMQESRSVIICSDLNYNKIVGSYFY